MLKFSLVFSPLSFFFFLILNIGFSYSSLTTFPKPEQLLGFRDWGNSPAKVQIIYPVDISFNEEEVKVNIYNSSLADEMLVSNFSDFRGAKWRPLENEFIWLVEKKPLISIFVILKKWNEERRVFETTPVLHDTVDKNNLHYKIVRHPYGYYNWTLNQVNFITEYKSSALPGSKISLREIQNRAEELSQLQFFSFINNLPIYTTFKGRNLLGAKEKELRNFFFTMDTIKISNQPNIIRLEKRFSLGASLLELPRQQRRRLFNLTGEKATSLEADNLPPPTFYGILKPTEAAIKPSPLYETSNYNKLIIDTRGSFYEPSLFLKVLSVDRDLVINASLFSQTSPQFVTYYKNLSKVKTDENTLIINSISINNFRSELTISNRYARILKSNLKNLVLISNGNFGLIVD